MHWKKSHCCHPIARKIADRHYSRQNPGSSRFVPPGRCFVLLGERNRAVWATSWPFAEFVLHEWPGAWICSIFRNEGEYRASDLITEAIAATRWYWPKIPELGMITFIDPKKVKPVKRRGRRIWGWVFLKAGFRKVGRTKSGLITLQMLPEEMPPPEKPLGINPGFGLI